MPYTREELEDKDWQLTAEEVPDPVDPTIEARIEALEQNAWLKDANGNYVIDEGKKILSRRANGATYHLLSEEAYPLTGDPSQTVHYVEIGNREAHFNANTDVDPEHGTHGTMDTPDGKKEFAFTADIPDISGLSNRVTALEQANVKRYGDLSETGGAISFTLGNVTFLLRRIDTTTLEVRATSVQDTTLPLSHRYSGANTIESLRETFTVGATGTTIGNIGVGTYVLAEFYTRIGNFGYDIVAGSDNNALSLAWVEVKRTIVIE